MILVPGKNIYREFQEGAYYHIYNRGVDKRIIFLDEQDYKVFLNNLKIYLINKEDKPINKIPFTLKGTTFQGVPHQLKDYHNKIELICYCLMPNHFHLLIKQSEQTVISEFMKSLTVKYSMYFNNKYKRSGQLFQSRYKAIRIGDEGYLLHLSRYIHLNPIAYTNNLIDTYSSYGEYLGLKKTKWINSEIILEYFKQSLNEDLGIPKAIKYDTYKDFVEGKSTQHFYDLTTYILEDSAEH